MTRWLFIICVSLILPGVLSAQKKYKREIKSFWKSHKSGLQQKFDGPLKTKDLKNLKYFPVEEKWKFEAKVDTVNNGRILKMPTSANKIKEYRLFGFLEFDLDTMSLRIPVYEMAGTNSSEVYNNYLFLPFTDLTNGETTYGGGRYLDLEKSSIEGNYLTVDFNKAYNPYCAYADGWNCPIPPVENRLNIAISAGEKIYTGKRRER